jgi:ferric-dicitrate binding protein FerR (iron transport regulator)
VTLPDSSTVVLNAGSAVRYPYPFERTEREVVLHGEGYFTVRHDAARPFRVRTNDAEILDVGTRFVVRDYDSSPGTVIVVVDGAVGVSAADIAHRDTVVVVTGMLARLTPSGTITTALVDTQSYTGFADGLLVLGNLTLAEAAPVIERWYDVKLHLTDPALGQQRLNENFRNEPLAGVIDALSAALGATIRRDGRDLTISRKAR